MKTKNVLLLISSVTLVQICAAQQVSQAPKQNTSAITKQPQNTSAIIKQPPTGQQGGANRNYRVAPRQSNDVPMRMNSKSGAQAAESRTSEPLKGGTSVRQMAPFPQVNSQNPAARELGGPKTTFGQQSQGQNINHPLPDRPSINDQSGATKPRP